MTVTNTKGLNLNLRFDNSGSSSRDSPVRSGHSFALAVTVARQPESVINFRDS